MLVQIFCDGACLGNPGRGGWAALLRVKKNDKTHEKMLSGSAPLTTNNKMELQAAISGLLALKQSCQVEVYSDSQYVVKGMKEWVYAWRRNEWKTAAKKPVENRDLWEQLWNASQGHEVTWHWVKGHAGHPENERVDEMARNEAEQCPGI